MKKTFNINVAGFPFVIDEDAYALLNDYLKTIEHAFRHVEGSTELINDIESRVAELLLACTEEGSAIITLSDVEQVISRVGKPEQFAEEASISIETDEGSETIDVESGATTPPPYIPNPPHTLKRLFRDPQNAMLGGVCSGLAWYLNWDVTWIRLLVVLLTILSSGIAAVVYILLCIVVPEARTPLQRMQMMGEQPTMENIGRTVTDTFREDQGDHVNPQPTAAPQAAGAMAKTFSLLAKILIICGLIIGIPILVAMALGLLGCIVFLVAWFSSSVFGSGLPFDNEEWFNPYLGKTIFWGVLCGIGWILTLGIPLFYLIRKGLYSSSLSARVRKVVNTVWVAGFILAGVSTGMVISSAYQQERYDDEQYHKRIHHHKSNNTSEIQDIDFEEEMISRFSTINVDNAEEAMDRLTTQAEHYRTEAEKYQGLAEKMMDKAETMIQKASNAKSTKEKNKYKKLASKANVKASKYQTKAAAMMSKAEVLMSGTQTIRDNIDSGLTTLTLTDSLTVIPALPTDTVTPTLPTDSLPK